MLPTLPIPHYNCRNHHFRQKSIRKKLSEVKRVSTARIRNVKDVYNALTDRENLNKVLEQGLDDDEYQRHRAEIVNLFMGLKDKIKIQDLILYKPIYILNIQHAPFTFRQFRDAKVRLATPAMHISDRKGVDSKYSPLSPG